MAHFPRSIIFMAFATTLILPLAACSDAVEHGGLSSNASSAAEGGDHGEKDKGTVTDANKAGSSPGLSSLPPVTSIPTVDKTLRGPLSFGSTYTMDNDSTITVGEPETYHPDGVDKDVLVEGKRLKRVRVTFVNHGSDGVDPASDMMPKALSNGEEAMAVYSSGLADGITSEVVRPGATRVFYLGYLLTPGKTFSLSISSNLDGGGAIWEGTVK